MEELLQNGSGKSATAMIMGQRAARFLKLFGQKPGLAMELRLPLPSEENQLPDGIENPFVITTLIAGIAGVTLSIIIILSIWILKNKNKGQQTGVTSQRLTALKGANRISHITATLPVNSMNFPCPPHDKTQNTLPVSVVSMVNPGFRFPQEYFPPTTHAHGTINIPMETSV